LRKYNSVGSSGKGQRNKKSPAVAKIADRTGC